MKLTGGQKKFLKALVAGEHYVCHTRVTASLFDAGYIFPRPGALFPWLVGCNSQMAGDYFLTEKAAELFA